VILRSWVRNGIFIASLSQSLIGVSLVWDKILLRQPRIGNLLNYIFWLGAISVFGLAVIPFGFSFPRLWIIAIAFLSGILDLIATYFYYAVLKTGEASGTVALMGGFSPVATVLFACVLLAQPLVRGQEVAFVILVVAGFIMFFAEHARFRLPVLLPRVAATSVLFGLENVLQKVVFNHTGFVSGFVFISLGTFCGAMFLLVRRSWRTQIFTASGEAPPSSRAGYFANRFVSGLGSFLVFYAINLTSPAIVDALSGLRYVIVFLGVLAFTRLKPAILSEDFRPAIFAAKFVSTAMVAVGLAVLAMHSGTDGGQMAGGSYGVARGLAHAEPGISRH